MQFSHCMLSLHFFFNIIIATALWINVLSWDKVSFAPAFENVGGVSLLFASELIKNIITFKQSNYLTCGDFLMNFLWDRKLKAGRYLGIVSRKVQYSYLTLHTQSVSSSRNQLSKNQSSSGKPAHQIFFKMKL